MTTLRESLQAEIVQAEAALAAKKAQLATFETTFVEALERDVDELKSFFRAVGSHLFGQVVHGGSTTIGQIADEAKKIAGAV